ncbi:MAG: trimethylamine methyltransferase family protein [Victivallales bacterium]|nr:trimethylamine methyltransferase family protein [Victivallales bacterium]MCF7888787.1 trimethylamine methyltransferase family protein [Victivallales bacterium]
MRKRRNRNVKAPHEFPGLKSSLYRPLSENGAKQIADSVFEVLEKGGVAVFSKTARDAYKKAGAVLVPDSNIVKLPRSFVEDCIASNPSSLTLASRDGKNNCCLESNRVHYGTGGTAIKVLDPDTGECRSSETKDVILNAKMVNNLDNIHIFTINVFPNEIENQDNIDVNRFFNALDNTTKHVMGGIYSMNGVKKVVEMAEMVAGGKEELKHNPFVSFITLIISPFKIDDTYGEMTCYLAEKGLPVVVPTEPVCGTTAPITLAGNVLTHIAETVAGITLVQTINKGAPGICGSVGTIPHLTTMDHCAGGIERGMINAAVSQMAQHFEIPFYGTGGTSDAKTVGVQSTYESAMSSLILAMSGANYIHDIAGLMEMDMTVAYDKLVIDNEILGRCQRVLRGIEVNDETLGVELMIKKGPDQDYLMEDHTMKYLRTEFCKPQITNIDKREDFNPEEDAHRRAKEKVRQIRNMDIPSCLPSDIREKILSKYPEIKTE